MGRIVVLYIKVYKVCTNSNDSIKMLPKALRSERSSISFKKRLINDKFVFLFFLTICFNVLVFVEVYLVTMVPDQEDYSSVHVDEGSSSQSRQ